MSDYQYTDHDGDVLRVYSHADKVHVQTTEEGSGWSTVAVDPEDAPTVALAILTAAGVNAGVTPKEWADPREGAAYYLAEWVSDRAEEKARRADEDGRIREWMDAVYPHSATVARNEPISDNVRERYRRSRDHFIETLNIPF